MSFVRLNALCQALALWTFERKKYGRAETIKEEMLIISAAFSLLYRKFRSTLRPLSSKPKNWRLSLEWHWHLKIRPVLLKMASLICAALSLLIVWSEMTYRNINPRLSVIGLLVQLASKNVSYGAIEAISFFTMLYMCTCAYTTLMKMKLLNNYVLVPNHHTDEPTLLFIGSYLCRLT